MRLNSGRPSNAQLGLFGGGVAGGKPSGGGGGGGTTSKPTQGQGRPSHLIPAKQGLNKSKVSTTEVNNRPVEERPKTLLKTGAAVSLGLIPNPLQPPLGPPVGIGGQGQPQQGFGQFTPTDPLNRPPLQPLQYASVNSFGTFVSTDSHFGNAIIPVLPRFEGQGSL